MNWVPLISFVVNLYSYSDIWILFEFLPLEIAVDHFSHCSVVHQYRTVGRIRKTICHQNGRENNTPYNKDLNEVRAKFTGGVILGDNNSNQSIIGDNIQFSLLTQKFGS